MDRLIPLRLRSSSSDLNSAEIPQLLKSASASTATSIVALPPIPAKSTARYRRPGPVTDLVIYPHTPEEWVIVLEEVKRLYMKRQYKQCSTLCLQLHNIKDPYRVHPLHSIYLSFYTASSLEITACHKEPLLRKSLYYYQKAESLIEYANFSTDPTIIQAARRRSSSISSSVRSSVDSVFSQATSSGSVCSSTMPSPTTSFHDPCSGNEQAHYRSSSNGRGPLAPAPLRVRKKVSFYPQLPTVISESDLATSTSISDAALIDAFPYPPSSPSPPPTLSSDSHATLTAYLLSRSLTRYNTNLSDLHIQLAYHIGSVNAQIHTLQTSCQNARRLNLPGLFTTDLEGRGRRGLDGLDMDEIKKIDLRLRIERLKESGWRRGRFSGERYQLLAEKAMAELE